MPLFPSFDDLELQYTDEGGGSPVLLLHGFASSSYLNWVRPGIVDALLEAGYRAVALDQRGHGLSAKPHEPTAYAGDAMVRDARALLDHLGIDGCAVVGYSMGAGVTFRLIQADDRVRRAVLGGIGLRFLDRARPAPDPVADALEAEDRTTITDRTARSFRDFADLTKSDRRALAAYRRAPRPEMGDPSAIAIPVLVLCGEDDRPQAPEALAERIPGARAMILPGTHLNVVNHPEFRRAIIEFLGGPIDR